MREQEHRIDAANVSYEQCENELSSIENEIEQVMAQTAEINTKIEQIRAMGSGYEEEALRKDGEASVLESTLKHNNDTIERLKTDIGMADDSSASIDAQIEEKNALIAENQRLSAEKKEQLKSVARQLEQVRSDNEELSEKAVEYNQHLASLAVKLSDSKVKCSQALSSIEEIKSRCQVIDGSIDEVEKEIKSTSVSKTESEENLAFLKERIDEYENSMEGYRIKLKNKTDKANSIKDELDRENRMLADAQSKAKMLSDLEKNMEGFSGAVKAVVKQSQSNALSGIHGPLSQLISVENEYSTAVEVALGAAMQNIVVGNESDAKRAINYLKQNNQGRATFLPISAIKPRYIEEKNLDDNFGFVAVAADLVKCDGK